MAKAVKEQNTTSQINATEAKKGSYVVAQEFRDITDFSIVHKVGDAVDFAEGTRLQELIEAGLVKEK